MDRKEFLHKSALFTLGGLLFPSALISSCRKNEWFDQLNYKGKVIIIGAGAAGLYAGYILKSKGIDFEILEASSSYGGRMGKESGFADYDVDTGAQWLHGRNSILGDLAFKMQTDITLDDSDLSYWFKNQVVTSLPKDPFIFEEDNLPDISFKDYAHQKDFGTDYDYIIEAIAGDQGASASLLSAYWNNKDEENWIAGDQDFKFKKTYFDFISENIAKPILDQITYNAQITQIDYSNNKVKIKDLSGSIYEADKVIVTVPISILKLNEIEFIPALPKEKTDAFSKFGMGPGMKVFLKFKENFYPENLIGGEICAAYADDTIGKSTNDNVLLAFVMGDQAEYLTSLGSDENITNAILSELDTIFDGQASQHFIDSRVYNYTDKPFIKGAYAYSTIGMGDARKVASKSINNTLFFAGEAVNINGHHQTVHGAVESGYMTALELLKNC